MKSIFGGAIMIIGTIMAISGGINLGQVLNEPFDYQAASPAERAEFLESAAVAISKSLKRALISPSGIGPKFRLAETSVNPGRRDITFVIKVQGDLQRGQVFRDARTDMFRKICPQYVPSELGRNKVGLTHRFVGSGNRTIADVRISSAACRQYL